MEKLKVKCSHCGKVQTQKVNSYKMDYELTCKFCKKEGECREIKKYLTK